MDKGIRPACNAKFVQMLTQRATLGNTGFRKSVMASIMEDFGITLASAATHYNHAFKEAKKAPELAVLLEGLGRPEDKKGGRKPKAKPEAAVETPAATEAAAETTPETTAEVPPQAPAEEAAPAAALYTVRKKSDGTVVAEGLSQEAADALVARAKAAKKAALEIA